MIIQGREKQKQVVIMHRAKICTVLRFEFVYSEHIWASGILGI